MQINQLKQAIREAIEKVLAENPAYAPSKPGVSPEPTIAPGKPGTDKPKPKASMNEEEMVDKIVKRFQSRK